jgi:hypothetical protein
MAAITDLPPTFTNATAMDAGLHPRNLYAARDAGLIPELSRGVFHRSDVAPASFPDLLAAARRAWPRPVWRQPPAKTCASQTRLAPSSTSCRCGTQSASGQGWLRCIAISGAATRKPAELLELAAAFRVRAGQFCMPSTSPAQDEAPRASLAGTACPVGASRSSSVAGARSSRSVPAGEVLGRYAELVALRVPKHGPRMTWQLLVMFNDRGTKPHQFVDG